MLKISPKDTSPKGFKEGTQGRVLPQGGVMLRHLLEDTYPHMVLYRASTGNIPFISLGIRQYTIDRPDQPRGDCS